MGSPTTTEKIPFGRPMIGAEEREAVLKVLESPQLVHGPKAKEFESGFAESLGNTSAGVRGYATTVSSCTAGLHLAYMHAGIAAGDEVIVPAQTHVATAHAVEIMGAKPMFVDCDPNEGNIDVDAIEAALTPRTRAISVVHYTGLPVRMDAVMAIAKKRSLFVVEDCALAVGSTLDGIACGLHGDVGAFSFYPVKHMTTAEGGMVVSKNRDVVDSIANIKAFGYDRTVAERKIPGVYDIARLGINYRMNEIAAAIGVEQLKKVPEFARRRVANTAALRAALADVSELKLLADGDARRVHSNYCLVAVLTPALGAQRAAIITELKSRGVGVSVYYPVPIPLAKYYREKYGAQPAQFPNALRISDHSIALPVGPHLTTDDMRTLATELKSAITKCKS
jgi:dTDP-4-amino-4,6-dideoxygalactose transaminase